MIKLSIMMVRRAGTSYEQFLEHWITVHAALICSQPATRTYIRRYVQNHQVRNPDASAGSRYDGIAEVWFDSMADAAAFLTSDDYSQNIILDEQRFLERDQCEMLYSSDHVVIEGTRA